MVDKKTKPVLYSADEEQEMQIKCNKVCVYENAMLRFRNLFGEKKTGWWWFGRD